MKKDLHMLAFIGLGLWVLTRRRVEWPKDGWVWPVMRISVNGRVYNPVITSSFYDMRDGEPHGGVDIVYPRRDAKDLVTVYPPGSESGGKTWFAPPRSPIVAARAGTIWSAGDTAKGKTVVISHGAPFATYYTHMDSLAVPPHDRGKLLGTNPPQHVNAGDIIGYMGYSPQDPERVRHLHFAVWYEGTNDQSVDPEPVMHSWPYAPGVAKI